MFCFFFFGVVRHLSLTLSASVTDTTYMAHCISGIYSLFTLCNWTCRSSLYTTGAYLLPNICVTNTLFQSTIHSLPFLKVSLFLLESTISVIDVATMFCVRPSDQPHPRSGSGRMGGGVGSGMWSERGRVTNSGDGYKGVSCIYDCCTFCGSAWIYLPTYGMWQKLNIQSLQDYILPTFI